MRSKTVLTLVLAIATLPFVTPRAAQAADPVPPMDLARAKAMALQMTVALQAQVEKF